MSSPTLSRLERAKMQIMMDPNSVFFSTLLCSLNITVDDTIQPPTAQTDGISIRFHSEFLEKQNHAQVIGLMLHEILHVAMNHTTRCPASGINTRWRIATDEWINNYLVEHSYEIPEGGHCNPTFKGMAAEEIYALLPEDPEDNSGIGDDLVSPGSLTTDDDTGQPMTVEGIAVEVQRALVKATTAAKMQNQAGSVPDAILRHVENLLNPVLPWQNILQRYASEKAKEDHSWAKRNRRFRHVYMPSLYSEQLGEFHFYIDGSCSVSEEDFSMQVNQIKWIKTNLNPKMIKIIIFNTSIVDVFEFRDDQPINVEFHARGGTCVKDVRDFMLKQKNVECSVVFTDGYFSSHSFAEVKNDIIWCIYDSKNFSADKGKVIYI